jgi:tetratricopeptide (TPR) repeat protein
MPDPRLFDMMHGVTAQHKFTTQATEEAHKDRYQLALEEAIRQYVKIVMQDEDPSLNKLISPEVRQAKLEKEILEAVEMPEYSQLLQSGVKILEEEGLNYMEKEEHLTLLAEIASIRSRLDALDLSTSDDSKLREAVAVSDDARASILKVGIAKFKEENFSDSLAIFTLLSTLKSDDPDYWYRLGIAAQRNGQYELAMRAYAACADLAPEFLGARIFSVQCCLKIDRHDEALAGLAEAKNILKISGAEAEWGKLIADIENLLLYADSIKEV